MQACAFQQLARSRFHRTSVDWVWKLKRNAFKRRWSRHTITAQRRYYSSLASKKSMFDGSEQKMIYSPPDNSDNSGDNGDNSSGGISSKYPNIATPMSSNTTAPITASMEDEHQSQLRSNATVIATATIASIDGQRTLQSMPATSSSSAASSSSAQRGDAKQLRFSIGAGAIPKQSHVMASKLGRVSPEFGHAGEDAYFTCFLDDNRRRQSGTTDDCWPEYRNNLFVGVSDGVGSWQSTTKKREAAIYSQQLMLAAYSYVRHCKFLVDKEMKPTVTHGYNGGHPLAVTGSVMQHAMAHVQNRKLRGSATLCCVQIDFNNLMLHASNLGDSGFAIFRTSQLSNFQYRIYYRSKSQDQGFGIPYQVGSHTRSNKFDDVDHMRDIKLQPRDVIVVGSDGIWDNLFLSNIAALITDGFNEAMHIDEHFRKGKKGDTDTDTDTDTRLHRYINSGKMNNKIVYHSLSNSVDKEINTPWSIAMTEVVEMIYSGGKPDDMSLVFIYVH